MKVIFASSLVFLQIAFQANADVNSSSGYASNGIDTVRLHDLNNSLNHHSGNIISIRQKLMEKEPVDHQIANDGEYSDTVLFDISEINNDIGDLVAKQNLLGAMESEHGKAMVSEHKKGDTKTFNSKCGNYLAGLNLSLSKIRDGALAFEVKGARDDVVKICGIVHNWE